MPISNIMRLRYIVGTLGIIIFGILTYSQVIESSVGVMGIIGILTALGIFEGVVRIRNA